MTNLPVLRDNSASLTEAEIITAISDKIHADTEAELETKIAIELGRLGVKAGLLLRRQAAKMFLTNKWAEPLPHPDDPNAKITFGSFRQWLAYVADHANIGEQAISAMYIYMVRVVGPAAKGLLKHQDGTEITVDQTLGLKEGHFQRAASAANAIAKNTDDEAKVYEQISELVENANKLKRSDFEQENNAKGLNRKRYGKVNCQVLETEKGTLYYILAENEPQVDSIRIGLSERCEFRTGTSEDLLQLLATLGLTSEEQEDLNEWLSNLK